MKIKRTLLVASLAACLAFCSVHGAISVTVSGGDSTPLTVTFNDDVTFTGVTEGLDWYGIVLLNIVPGNTIFSTSLHSGTASWNGTGNNSGNGNLGFINPADLTLADLFIFWASEDDQPVSTSTMTLSAGDRVSVSALGVALPQGTASYETVMMDVDGNFISAVPEPASYAGLLALGVLGCVLLRRRRTKLDA